MKFIFLIVLLINLTKCSVTNRKKSTEVTTQVFDENETRENQFKDLDYRKHNSVPVENQVYLDDVMFRLNNQNWNDEEKPCLDHIYRLLHGLQNFTLWAVWDWDAQSSEPQGLLFGNRYQLGNFDQCMSAPWSHTHQELRTKYCLAEIVLERTDMVMRKKVNYPFSPYQSALDYMEYHPPHTRPLNELTWGACVPSSCQPRTVERLLEVMLSRSHLGTAGMRANISVTEDCQMYDDSREYDGLFYGFVGFVSVLVAISLLCTFLNNRKKKLNPDNFKTGIIQAFCLRKNAVDLLKIKKEGIEVFYGIRFLTICLIVLDHQIGITNAGPISDGYTSDQETKSLLGMLILHNDLFVDTFFLLSGFLTITSIAKIKKLPNPLFIILKRYVRLVVALAVVVFYVSAVFPYTGSGPLWNRAKASETNTCRKNWWLNLLMVSNYIDTENICIVASWYIPCDFHFFLVTVLLFYLYKSSPLLGLLCGIIVTVASVVVPGIVNYLYQLPPVQLFTFEFITDPRASEDFHVAYIKSHTRYAAYLVGFISGYVFLAFSSNGNLNRITKKWAILGTVSALILMLVVMVSGSTFLLRSYHPLEGAVYAALNRPAWACGVALLVLCSSFGHVPLVKGFLSWYPWVPLSRLSYGLYLTHTVLITRNVFVTRNPQHNDYFEILNSAAGVIFWGCVAALLIWLFAEAPANKLLAVCLRSRVRKFKEKQEETAPSFSGTTSISTIPTGSGHLQENLPTTIHFSSKMKSVKAQNGMSQTDEHTKTTIFHDTFFLTLNSAAGVIFWGCVAALLIWLFAEAPANKLLAVCLRSRVRKFKEKQEETAPSFSGTTSISTIPTGSGHLQENLPTTIHFSSKM